MTDEQIMDYIGKVSEDAYRKGYAQAAGNRVKDFIDFLWEHKIPGIGAVTVNKISRTASDNGFI